MIEYTTEKREIGLLDMYESLIEEFDIKGTLLEIGVWTGGSLLYAYNTNRFSKIIGVDVDINKFAIPEECKGVIELHQFSQSDSHELSLLKDKYKEFDIVIDDGSHYISDVKASFDILWYNTKKVYVIEDWAVMFPWESESAGWLDFLRYLFNNKKGLGIEEVRIAYNHTGLTYQTGKNRMSYIVITRGELAE